MCFIVHPDNPDPIVATDDIICYKDVMRFVKGMTSTVNKIILDKLGLQRLTYKELSKYYVSGIRSFIYEKGKRYDMNELLVCEDFLTKIRTIHSGFHSYQKHGSFINADNNVMVTIQCRIPKGATYYRNDNDAGGIYVSSSIIIDGDA